MSVDAKPVEGMKVDVSNWTFNAEGLPDAVVGEALSEALQVTLEDSPPTLEFPWQWRHAESEYGAEKVISPTTLCISLPFSQDQFMDEPKFHVEFREVILDALDNWCEYDFNSDHQLRVSVGTRAHLEKFVSALEADVAWARELLTNSVAVDDDTGHPVEALS